MEMDESGVCHTLGKVADMSIVMDWSVGDQWDRKYDIIITQHGQHCPLESASEVTFANNPFIPCKTKD